MYLAYILKSIKDNSYYYGHTSNMEYRLKCHNAGKVKSTKGRGPWTLHYYERYENKQDAMNYSLNL